MLGNVPEELRDYASEVIPSPSNPNITSLVSLKTESQNTQTPSVRACRMIELHRGNTLTRLMISLRDTLNLQSCTLHPTPYTLHPTPYTLHPTPHTLHPTPYTLHPTPYTLNPKSHTLNPKF